VDRTLKVWGWEGAGPSGAPSRATHLLQPDETLASVAQLHNVRTSQLQAWNDLLAHPELCYEGSRLFVEPAPRDLGAAAAEGGVCAVEDVPEEEAAEVGGELDVATAHEPLALSEGVAGTPARGTEEAARSGTRAPDGGSAEEPVPGLGEMAHVARPAAKARGAGADALREAARAFADDLLGV